MNDPIRKRIIKKKKKINKMKGLTASNLVATVPAIVVEIAFPVRRQTLCRNKLKKKKKIKILLPLSK